MPARLIGAIGSIWGRLAAALGAVLCLAAAAASQGSHGADGVVAVRLGGDMTTTRIVIELDQTAKGRLIAAGGASGPVILALPGVPVGSDLEGRGLGLVSNWAVDSAAGAARVRLALARPAEVRRRFLLPPADGVGVYRYVIDLEPVAAPAAPAVQSAQAATPKLIAASSIAAVSPPPPPAHLKKIIVIDPGHGGKDPGAQGTMSREKDLNLAAARVLKAKLERTGRYRVVMTRYDDVFVPLESRVQIARRANADLFISLHSDSGSSPDLHGATVYTLSDKGSERTAHGVMDSSDWFINVDLPGQTRAVNQILLDLTQRATRNRSDAFAEDLLGHIGDRAQAHASHRDASFMVLLAPDVPAVLLEMGFITNADDERLLNNPARRDRFMGEVADSIDNYFRQETQLALR
ncbi:MAG TPA: N-acetylmuramoyl-L-alanine amidase [Caulobacteraceae bacterium]|jgi:N-acetylmuramoyl-L-alanine amidase|nr:N-acetylmuramoyl-L-alanine amidase [Caulobacteraceae bacterium]